MFLVALIFIAGSSIYGQVAPAATETHPPLTFGLGYSSYHTDWNGYLSGPMFWADWRFRQSSKHLGGIGVEMEARDLNYQRTGVVSNLRMDAAGGGPIYTWRHFRRIQPYGKFLVEFGSIDFTIQGIPDYTHDTRVVRVPGGGMNYHVSGNLWMRGDYEYQVWPHLGHGHALTPYGFTFGFSYDFSSSFAR
jgi:hypothetical protein